MLRVFAGLATLAVGATLVLAQNLDAIKQRQDAMDTIAKPGLEAFKMLKGELPFDLAKVQAALKTYQEQGAKLKTLFPDDSKTGGDTDAQPKIWQARAEFDKALDGFITTARNAAAAIKDEASFKAEYPAVTKTCGECHKSSDGFSPSLSESMKRVPK
jgi:cytochrome c556